MVCFLISNGCLVVWLITQAPVWISPVIVVLLVGFGFFAVKGGQKQYEAKKRSRLESGKRLTRKKFWGIATRQMNGFCSGLAIGSMGFS